MGAFKFSILFMALFLQCFAQDVGISTSPPQEQQEQRRLFQKKGYLWIKNFFSPEQAQLLQKWAEEINGSAQTLLALSRETGKPLQYFSQTNPEALIIIAEARDPLLACRAEDLLTCYPDLYSFIFGTVTSYIGQLLDEPYVLFKDKINFKWPGGGAFTPHQDFPAYEFFGPREHVTAMICIDPATLENGCLHVAENWTEAFGGDANIDPELLKTGRAVLPYITGGKNHGSIQPQYAEKIEWQALETSPRDLVLISSFIPHYSEPNRSSASRRAMFFTHNKLSEGEHRKAYYQAKRQDPDNPVFHFATPTKARNK